MAYQGLSGSNFMPGGISFSPTDNTDPRQRPGGSNGGAAGSDISQAIQVLQLRLPHFFGAAPSPLIGAGPANPVGFDMSALRRWLQGIGGLTLAAPPAAGQVGAPSAAEPFSAPAPPTSPVVHYGTPPGQGSFSGQPQTPITPPPQPATRPAPAGGFRPGPRQA